MEPKIEKLKKLDSGKLCDVVKNYRQYGYDEQLRTQAILILEERGITSEQLKLTGNFTNSTYDFAGELYKSYILNSKIAFSLYGIMLVTDLLIPILVKKSETLQLFTLIAGLTTFAIYLVYLIKSFINQNRFYKAIGQDFGTEGALLYFFLGMPFYFAMYFWLRNQMKEKMKEIL